MMSIINNEALMDRAGELEALGLNGMKLILVDRLETGVEPSQAILEVYFFNAEVIDTFATGNPAAALSLFTVSGGRRVKGGEGHGEVRVVKIEDKAGDPQCLVLTLEPIGDYSTYTLHLVNPGIDPLFGKIDFKFRPGCFNIDCASAWKTAPAPKKVPVIDYLAKDYDSFKHTLINAMMERVPGWRATSEADLDQVLIDLFSAAADELSDYQDRVMNEAYLGTARKRVSLARHARLMDYHIHQGNQASTWLALELAHSKDFHLGKGFTVWTGTGDDNSKPGTDSSVFISNEKQYLHYRLNRMGLYTWSDSIPALKAGSVTADLKIGTGGETETKAVQTLIRNGSVTRLLIQEALNPATGKAGGTDPGKRQVLRLLPGDQGAEALEDPVVTGQWYLRVKWRETDKLKHNYCFTVDCPGGKKENISFFNGNLVRVYHGRPQRITFIDPSETPGTNEFFYQRTRKRGTICPLPDRDLAYKNTPPGGEIPSETTLEVEVEVNGSVDPWDEVISLVSSGSEGERGDHFAVETDEEGKSLIRFGNGLIGKELPDNARVYCSYQEGRGPDGNIGADTLNYFDKTAYPDITGTWNPFDVVDGRAPEPVEEIIRRVPEAFRARQLRAVTLKDYEDRAEELEEVSRAAAQYAWTGSWRAVQITVDPAGTTEISPELSEKLARHLDAVRLIGEDIEIRPPRWVPLEIEVSLCVKPQYWPEDIKAVLDREFSDGYLPDGRTAFFHPDNWTFGQSLHFSRIVGRVHRVQGVDHVISVFMKRFNEPGTVSREIVDAGSNEILLVRNNPDFMEEGSITFFVEGGRG